MLLVDLALLAALAAGSPGEVLSKRYKPTLDDSGALPALQWSSGPKDVWTLSGFELDRGGELRLELGPSTATFGVVGTDAIWAVVAPEEPAPLARSRSGGGELVTSVLLRFNPHRIDDLFPPRTVKKNGPPQALLLARYLVANKLLQTGRNWHVLPIVHPRNLVVVDCELEGGKRRVFYVDTDLGTVALDDRLTAGAMPAAVVATTRAASVDAFDAAWKEFDRTYAKFQLRPEVDWDALYERYEPLAEKAQATWETATAIALLVEHLRDLHVHVTCGEGRYPSALRFRPQNGSIESVPKLVAPLQRISDDVRWARTEDGIGYVVVFGVGSEDVTRAFDAALEQLGTTWGLVLDLRFNGGGATDVAASLAGRFAEDERVYAKSQFRAGSKRTALTPHQARVFGPRGPWRYGAPVAVLLGQRCMSSGEELALMMEQVPRARSFGDRTAGSSAAPKLLELAGGIAVNVPRWNDCDAEGRPYEDVGVPPDVPITNESSAFAGGKDPVLEAALAHLRGAPEAEREPGRVVRTGER
jgi:hypothetical protein